MKAFIFVLTALFALNSLAKSSRPLSIEDVTTWEEFRTLVQQQENDEILNGRAYIISGAVLVLGGMIGYHNAKTSVEKLAYSVTESLGVAGIGYGAYLNTVGSPQRSLYESIEASKSLTLTNKNDLVRNYALSMKENRKNERLIKIVTHSIVSAVNLYNGLREEGELRQGLIALGGIHFLAAISVSFQ